MMKKYLLIALSVLFVSPVFAGSVAPPKIPEKDLYFLSPHSDDIPLTFGGLIEAENGFKGHNNHYTVFFSRSNYTANHHDLRNDKRINTVTLMRTQEDLHALTELFGSWHNFSYMSYGLSDSLLRDYKGPKTAGGGPGGDFSTFREPEIKDYLEIARFVTPILKQKSCAAFVLMANGSHIDHFIVREAVIKAAYDLGDKAHCQIYFGEDQPYTGSHPEVVKKEIKALDKRLGLKPIVYSIDVAKKEQLFQSNYISQFEPSYMPALVAHAKSLNNGERIYQWPIKSYKRARTAKSCHNDYCRLSK